MVTGDRRTGPKKYSLVVTGITDKLRTNRAKKCGKKKINKIIDNSTDIRSESYWHKINYFVEC